MTAASPSLVRLLQQRVQEHPDRLAYVFLSGENLRQAPLTYRELDTQAGAVGAVLRQLKAPGERALLLYPPGLEFIAAFLGCLYAGVIAVPAYPPRLNRNALRIVSIARDSGATLALSTREVCARLPAIAVHTPELAQLRWIATDNLDLRSAQESQVAVPRQDGLAYLQYTSGSTAYPKGVMISHANVLDNSRYVADVFGHSKEDISVSWLPHFHDLGLVHGILQPLYSGFPGYLMAPMSFLQRPLDWLKAISRFRITHSDGPNFAYELCVSKIGEQEKAGLDLSSWRMALNGAEPVFAQTIERFTAAFARCGFDKKAFYPAYGLAEATLVVSGGKESQAEMTTCSVVSSALEQNKVVIANGSHSDQRILVGSGKFAPPMKVEVVDSESSWQCAPDEIGEIWVSGPSVALGYWNRPEETKKIFRAKLEYGGQHFLRTGDLGFVHRGDLFITGRLKELIIVRGRNYYPQDIEQTAREACAEFPLATGVAFSISIGTEERVVLVQELQRRQKVEISEVFCRIRNAVAEEYELQLVEIVLVKAGSIPKTSSGKLQRRLCRKEFLEGKLQEIVRWRFEGAEKELQADDAAPLTSIDAIQDWLRSRIAVRIGCNPAQVDISQPLVRFGLDSLGAVELAHDVQKKLGMVWQASAFLEDVTIADLAARVAEALSAPQLQIPLPSSRGEQESPLSFGQQGLWFLHQLSPESAAYNIVQAIRITCEIDLPALRRSFQALVERHVSLRTNFAVADGRPMQRVRKNTEVSFCSEDAGSWSEAQLRERLTAEAHKPFNLADGPLFRVQMFSRSAREHVLLLTAHHIILDLWSLAQLMAELAVIYPAERSRASASLPLPSSDYAQFVHWQKEMLGGERGLQLWSYWNKQLAGELPVLELPTDRARPAVQTYVGSSWPLKLNAELTSKLKGLSQRCSATLYVTLLAAFQVLLRVYTAEQDIVVGSPAAGRTRHEFAAAVGYFVNPVVLRTTVSPDCPFDVLLRDHVRKTVLDALEHQDFPFALLNERLQPVRDPRRSPIFQVLFAMQKAHLLHDQGLSLFALGESTARTQLGGLEMQSIALEQRIAQFDLSLILAEASDGIAAIFEYNTDLFEAATIGRMARHFQNLLENVAGNPEQRISCLSLLANAEATQVVASTQPAPGVARTVAVDRMFEKQAARTPGATAIVFEGQQLSYRDLNERANRMARYLLRSAVRPGTRVAICLERSAEMIVSLLGAFKSGAVYVPLDPEYPRERLEFLLHDCGAEVLITRKRLLHPTLEGRHRVIYLEAEEDLIAQESGEDTAVQTDTNSFAYIIYTSGSTGLPKGVVISHGAFSNQMQWLAQEFPLYEHDRVLHKYSLSFDASLAEIFHPLTTGAGLIIARAGGQHDMRYLTELIREHQVSEIDAVPTMLKALFDEQEIGACKSLRRIISGGEALSTEVQQRIFERLGPVELVNMYGPTESTITATFHRCFPEGNRARVPIGVAIAETQVDVLDSRLQPVPIGVSGEIHISGRSLACGYLNQPSFTAEKFIPDPFNPAPGARLYRTGDLGRQREDGVLEYLGRADRQVKIHGFRIELAEIEHELRKLGQVKDVVVVTKARSTGENYIAAYVEPVPGQSITPARVRAKLSEILPGHLIPGAIVVLDQLPRLPSGKADVRALPEPASAVCEKQPAAPRNEIEAALVMIWEQVLGRANIGIYDNFFELGGDSILSIQAVARAREIGFELAPKQMFRFQTVAALAEVVGRNSTKQESFETTGGPFPLTPIQQWFFQQDLNTANQYTQSLLLEFDRALDLVCLREAVQQLISRHDALLLRFEHTDAGWQQRTADPGSATALEYFSLIHLSSEDQQKHAEAMTADIRSGLDIANGPLIRAAYFDFGQGKPHRLLICIHHLAIDAVSWRILLDDLHRVYDQLTAGEKPAFAGTPLAFQRWAELLQRHAQSKALAQELAWWRAELKVPPGRLPIDDDGENTAASSATLRVSLPSAETGRLLREVPQSRTEIIDVLLTALAHVLANRSSNEAVLIDLEGHGREEIVDGVDPSGTVGWFTSVYPVLLPARSEWGLAERLKSVKEHLRKIPGKGIGFGLLRYLCVDEAITGPLKASPHAEISFNYLGQLDQMCPAGSPFRIISLDGPAKTSFGKRSHVLEIDAYVKDGALQVQWTYSTQLHHRNTIEALASRFLKELQKLIQHCASPLSDQYTCSDFPLVQLTERQLARIREAHGAIEDIYPLSAMQQGMLFHSLYEPQKGTYLTQLVCEFSGELDGAAFQGAWQAVTDNHSALRSEFEWEIVTEEPVQLTAQGVRPKWHFGDWSYAGSEEQSKLLDRYLKEDRAQEMNLERAPLIRFALFATGNSKHVFVWSSHHLLMDGWSLPLVLKNVFAAYNALSRQQWIHLPPERPYRDYIEWLRQQDFTAAEKFWRGSLQGFTTPATLEALHRPADRALSNEAFCEYEVRLSESETTALREFARDHRLTLSTVVYGAWAVVLSRITGKNDLVFGGVVSGRQLPLARAGEMVGVFINTLPVRAKIEPEAHLGPWLKGMQDRQAEAARFEHSSLSSIQSWSELPRGVPLFDHILVFENYPAESWNQVSNELRILNMRSLERSNYALTVWIVPGRQLCVRVGYDRLFLDSSKVTAVLERYGALLATIGTLGEQQISEVVRVHAHLPFALAANSLPIAATRMPVESQNAAIGFEPNPVQFGELATAVTQPEDDTVQHVRAAYGSEGEEQKL